MNGGHSLCVEHINNNLSNLVHIIICLVGLYLFYKNDVLLVNSSYEILCLCWEYITNGLKGVVILLILCLNYKNNTSYICVNMKLLCSVIYINQKQIIKKKILDKVILIKSFLVCYKQILNLECGNLAYHIRVISLTLCQKDMLQLIVIKHFKKLIAPYYLAFCRWIDKCTNCIFTVIYILKCRGKHLSLCIQYTKVCSCNIL